MVGRRSRFLKKARPLFRGENVSSREWNSCRIYNHPVLNLASVGRGPWFSNLWLSRTIGIWGTGNEMLCFWHLSPKHAKAKTNRFCWLFLLVVVVVVAGGGGGCGGGGGGGCCCCCWWWWWWLLVVGCCFFWLLLLVGKWESRSQTSQKETEGNLTKRYLDNWGVDNQSFPRWFLRGTGTQAC